MPDSSRCDVFISYRREGGEALAMLLHDRLADAGYRVFLDVESLRSGNFNEAILGKIEECTDMLVLLPPNALDRCVNEDDWVRREVEHAFLHGKNIVPVMMRGFSWPDSLPESLSALPSCNGVTADNMELFDGILLRIQDKLLRSKPSAQRAERPENKEFSRLYHRAQYLMTSREDEAVNEILTHMQEAYPDRAEVYLCRLQYIYDLPQWDQLGTETIDFENEPDWQYALRIASPALKLQMQAVLADSLALREKRAEEYRLEQERKAEAARAKKLRKEEEKRRKAEEAHRQAELERHARVQAALLVRDEAIRRFELLQAQPPVLSQLDELYELRDMLLSVQEECQTGAQAEACTQMIAALLEGPAEEAKLAAEILQCYSAYCDNLRGMARMDRDFYEMIGRGDLWRKALTGNAGIVSAARMTNGSVIALLADGTTRSLANPSEARAFAQWTDLRSLTIQDCVMIGIRQNGTVVAYNSLAGRNKGCGTEQWAGITAVVSEDPSSSSFSCVAGLTQDGTVLSNPGPGWSHDTSAWSNIKSIHAFGELLIGSKNTGETVVAKRHIAGSYDKMAAVVAQWRNIVDIAGQWEYNTIIGRNHDGTLDVYSEEEGRAKILRYGTDKINERGVCQADVVAKGSLILLNTNGDLILYHAESLERTLLLHNVLGFVKTYHVLLALLRDGRVAEIDLSTRKSTVYSCAMTEEAVREGLPNWRKLQARKLLAQRERELRSLFLMGTRRKKCQRSIEYLQAVLAEQ